MRLAPLFILLAACVAETDIPEGEDGTGATDETVADDKADTTEIRARVEGMTVWMDATAYTFEWNGNTYWKIDGRASRNLEKVTTFVPDDTFATADLTGKRTFSITFGDDHEINTILSGMPLFFTVDPLSGDPATGALWLAPHTTRWSGSTQLYVHSTVDPVWVNGDVVYRGTITTPANATATVISDAGPSPTSHAFDARHTDFDFGFDAMKPSLASAGAPLHATAGTLARSFGLDVRTARLGLTLLDPNTVWPSDCDEMVRSCLKSLPSGTTDAAECGTYREVLHCGALPQ